MGANSDVCSLAPISGCRLESAISANFKLRRVGEPEGGKTARRYAHGAAEVVIASLLLVNIGRLVRETAAVCFTSEPTLTWSARNGAPVERGKELSGERPSAPLLKPLIATSQWIIAISV